ncbi:flagellar export chaperone FliS [Mesoaciditoga lauensis]|uniref:flagellar export chaperone FliS n=1 Tax=Mesoaciditoga lauensis TaxID=1495039 RepID=UPI000568B81E|nr:flagellar export chaperone FliS [Mesoaciditoga lauensis]
MDEYTQNAVLTASPEKLVEMLYEKAVELISKAISDIKNAEARNAALVQAEEIILYLNAILDMEKGGEISQNLRSLYDFIYRQLVDGNVNADVEKLKISKELIEELLETWKEVEKKAKVRPAMTRSGGFSASA